MHRVRGRVLLGVLSGYFVCALAQGAERSRDAEVPTESERPFTAALSWGAPEGSHCPASDPIVSAVEARLERKVFVETSAADVFLRVAFERSGTDWRVHLELLDGDQSTLGTRELRSQTTDCAALLDVLPVVVALLLDASRTHVRLTLPPPKYEPAPSLSHAPATEQPALKHSEWRVGWGLLGEVTYDLLPGVVLGGELVGGVEPPSTKLPLEFSLGFLLPASTDKTEGARLSLTYVGAAMCPELWSGWARGAFCGGIAAGVLRASGQGYDVDRDSSRLHLDARAGLQLKARIHGPLFLRFDLGLVVPLLRNTYVGESEPGVRTNVFRPSVIAPRAAVGVGVGF